MKRTVPQTEPPREPTRIPVKLCPCGAYAGECDCAELAIEMERAPLIKIGVGWYR